ncbi:MAG: FAD-dependent oxidoreductase [Alphaproteobacteria bacterium]|nr:FAD-dependent oxidoreductase [Alphaproteobacteria bacterium]
MRTPLSALDGKSFDVVVIGAGVNGSSAAQHLAAAGFSTLLVDKGDFASGSSSRSTRLLHCGLRYLAPGASMWEFVLHPDKLMVALRMAKQGMESRAQMVEATGERTRALKFCFPIYADGPYSGWQVDLAFRLLTALGPKSVPLDYRRLDRAEVSRTPLVQWLRAPETLRSVAMFREYQFEWPERICMDAVLDAERLGASVRNYTSAAKLDKRSDGWGVALKDTLDGTGAAVTAKVVLNMAGIWIDQVNASAGVPGVKRKILGTKGVHIMIRLPPECQDYGIATLNRVREPFYCVPWRGMHYIGPTETVYEGNVDDIRPEDADIDFIVSEANHLLPALNLKRSDILFTWAGVRPLGADPAYPKGKRSREVHDLAAEGMPNVLAMTAGPVMTHRSAGQAMTEAVAQRLKPSRAPQPISYAARRYADDPASPSLLNDHPTVKLAHLRQAAAGEHVTNLADILFRRTGAGWTASMGYGAAEKAAEAVADLMGWSPAQVQQEARKYRAYLESQHRTGQLA